MNPVHWPNTSFGKTIELVANTNGGSANHIAAAYLGMVESAWGRKGAEVNLNMLNVDV